MNVVVDGTPESCLAQVEAFFGHGWWHGGNYKRPTPNTLTLPAWKRQHRFMFESPGGILLLLIVSLITAGACLPIYGLYWMLRDSSSRPEIYTARVVATPESSSRTALSTSASKDDWAQTL